MTLNALLVVLAVLAVVGLGMWRRGHALPIPCAAGGGTGRREPVGGLPTVPVPYEVLLLAQGVCLACEGTGRAKR